MKFLGSSITLAIIAISSFSVPIYAYASSAGVIKNQTPSIESHFLPRPSVQTRLDFDAWDFMLSETVLYMGPSTRTPAARKAASLGSRLPTGNKSRIRMEGNKILYDLMNDKVKSEMKNYAEELIALGNRIDIPSLPRNEQLAYWINLHNAVIVTTIIDNYPGPRRQPSLIKPIKGSETKLHDANIIEIDGHPISLRDIREKIVFPNWKNKDVPFAFHLGYLSSPSLANSAYDGTNIRTQLARNAYEFMNSLRGYERGKLNPYISEISPWYFPKMDSEMDSYFQRKMRPEVYAEFIENGVKEARKQDLAVADITGGHGSRLVFANTETSSRSRQALGSDIDDFLKARASKFSKLRKKEWFRRGTVTIEDTPTDSGIAEVE